MQNPLRRALNALDPQTAIDDGWACAIKRPVLSEERKKRLMEATALETPRNSWVAALTVLAPYATKSSAGEKVIAASLLATSLFMTWYAVQVTVEFGNWQSGLTNTVQQLFQAVMASRPEIIADSMGQFPALQELLQSQPVLNEVLLTYPDATSILYDPQFAELVQNAPGLAELLQQNPTIEDVFTAIPAFKDKMAENPELLTQLTGLKDKIGTGLWDRENVQGYLSQLKGLAGAGFIDSWGGALRATFNSAADAMRNGNILSPINEDAKKALADAWYSKDLATIALKFTAMAIISYKSAQYLALRWRAWTTGYYTNKWLHNKAFQRLRDHFNNIDNPGQRIQLDPASFTGGAVSLMTGVMSAGMTLASFSGMLWGMGTFFGVPHAAFWLAATYAAGLTALTVGVGRKLPWIQWNQEKREADLRSALDEVHNNADLIAQNGTEAISNDLIKKRFRPVMTNSVRAIGMQVKLIIVDATAGNLSIPVPWLFGAFAIAGGTASMGTVQTINYAFNRVTSSLSFIVNRFDQLTHMKAVADRIYMFDRAMDAAHYMEEERRQASLKLGPA